MFWHTKDAEHGFLPGCSGAFDTCTLNCVKKEKTELLPTTIYKMRQFNFQNGSVKANFAYLVITGCCEFQRTGLMKLCSSWDDGAIARNVLGAHFPELFQNVFTRSWMSGMPENLCLSRYFSVWEMAKNVVLKKVIAKSGQYLTPFFLMDFFTRNRRTPNATCAGALSW